MAKIALYFLLLVGLVDSVAWLRQIMALTVIFIAITALLAVLNYHDIYTLPALTVLDRGLAIDSQTGEMESVLQLQATGIFSDPNDFSVILAVAILGAIYFIVEAKDWLRRMPWLAITPLLVYAFALTRSRGGFLGLMAGVAALMVARMGWKRAMKIGIFVFPVLLVAFAGRQTNIDVGDKEDTALRPRPFVEWGLPGIQNGADLWHRVR